jgi:glycosyltransferase involved in cell wall biosynthesis
LTVIDTLMAGGAERVAVEVAAALDRERWNPFVVVTRTDGPLAQILDDAQVRYRILGKERRFERAAWRALVEDVDAADLVHSHKMGSNIWAAAAGRRTGTPVVGHEHNFSSSSGVARKLLDKYWIAPRIETLICVSESVARTIRDHGVQEQKIRVIPNGVRLQGVINRSPARAELGVDDGDFIIGIVGRLRPEKAQDVLIAAVEVLRDRGVNVRAVIVGDGPCRSALEDQVDGARLQDRVIFAGEHTNASRLAKAFDVGVISSHWEGLPLAALEIMAAGVPLVSTDVGGLSDLLSGGVGRLVPPNDPVAMADSLEVLRNMSTTQRDAQGLLGQERVRGEYQFSTMVERITSVYEEVLRS